MQQIFYYNSYILVIAFLRRTMMQVVNIAITTSHDTGQHINNIPILRWNGRTNAIQSSRSPHTPMREYTAAIPEYPIPRSAAVNTSWIPQRKYGRPVTIIRTIPCSIASGESVMYMPSSGLANITDRSPRVNPTTVTLNTDEKIALYIRFSFFAP